MRRIILLTAALTAACGSSASQVPVKGDTEATDSIAGDWAGDYTGIDSGRTGDIRFSLTLGRHTADGQVLMKPTGSEAEPQPLAIQFVEVQEDGAVSGKIAPYTDPQCQCQVETEFLGTLQGDVMEGTFTTRVIGRGTEQTGRWTVRRQSP